MIFMVYLYILRDDENIIEVKNGTMSHKIAAKQTICQGCGKKKKVIKNCSCYLSPFLR